MSDALTTIEAHVAGLTLDQFLATRLVRDAVTWNFCVIGEALSQLAKIDEATACRLSDYRRIIGLRNQLIHGYGVINHEITWKIVTEKLPILRSELENLLA